MKKRRTRKKILVVDDDWAILELLKFTFSSSGFEVALSQSAEEFREKALSEKPDAIVLDIMLGTSDGTKVYHELLGAGLSRKVPVVFLSVLAQNISTTPPQSGRTYALVAKPFDPEKLVREVARVLEG